MRLPGGKAKTDSRQSNVPATRQSDYRKFTCGDNESVMQTRIFTRIAELGKVPKAKHYLGLPPELTGGKDIRQELPTAVLAIIEEAADGIFLKRYDRDGNCVGDTWHMNIAGAKAQALFEYEDAIAGWEEVPNEVADAVSFGLSGKSGAAESESA